LKKLNLSDLRAQRLYLENDDYGIAPDEEYVPVGAISEGSWSAITLLPDTVALMTTDAFTNAIETMQAMAHAWLQIWESVPDNKPLRVQVLAAHECFEGGIFSAIHGWYRLAGVAIRNAIDDILVGLYYQHQKHLYAEFEEVTTGKRKSPGRGKVDAQLLRYAPKALVDDINALYTDEMSIYVHRMSDGELWEGSNGPVYVHSQMNTWIGQYERAFRLLCKLIEAVQPGSGVSAIADKIQFKLSL